MAIPPEKENIYTIMDSDIQKMKKTWKIVGGGVGDYMSDWYIWINGKKFVEPPQHRC